MRVRKSGGGGSDDGGDVTERKYQPKHKRNQRRQKMRFVRKELMESWKDDKN